MSIEVLTRRIERLKHHVQTLDEAGVVVPPSLLQDVDSMASKGTTHVPEFMGKVRISTAKSSGTRRGLGGLPNASFGSGASLVTRQRQALAHAVQQAAARGVSQIREELHLSELALYESLLQRYLVLCDQMGETPDPTFIAFKDELRSLAMPQQQQQHVDKIATPRNQVTHSTGEQDHDPPLRVESSPTTTADESQAAPIQLNRSSSVVGLDTQQRSRNATVEQLAVACQLLLVKRRKLDLLEAKVREVEQCATRFHDVLAECKRLTRNSGATKSSASTTNTTPASPGNATAGSNQPNQASPSTLTTANASSPQNIGSQQSPMQSPRGSIVSPAAHGHPSTLASGVSVAQMRAGGGKLAPITSNTVSSGDTTGLSFGKKVLVGKVNDALADIRQSAVRLLLYISDLHNEFGEGPASLDASMLSDPSAGTSFAAASAATGAWTVVFRKQQVIHERLMRMKQGVRVALADAHEFCPPSLGLVCSTPMFLDPSTIRSATNSGASFTTPSKAIARKSLSITVPQPTQHLPPHRDGGDGTPRASLKGGREASTYRKKSLASTAPGGFSDNSSSSVAVGAMLRSGGVDPLTLARAFDVWRILSNSGSIDNPPTSVPFVERFVAVNGSDTPTPHVALNPVVIDKNHPELLVEVTGCAGATYRNVVAAAHDHNGVDVSLGSTNTSALDELTIHASAIQVDMMTASRMTLTENDLIAAVANAAAMVVSTPSHATSPHTPVSRPPSSLSFTAPLTSVIEDHMDHSHAQYSGLPSMVEPATRVHDDHDVTDSSMSAAAHISGIYSALRSVPKHGGARGALLAKQQAAAAAAQAAEAAIRQAAAEAALRAEEEARGSRLAEIAKRLTLLDAHRRLRHFAKGYVVGSRHRTPDPSLRNEQHTLNSSNGLNVTADEPNVSALLPFETDLAEVLRMHSDGRGSTPADSDTVDTERDVQVLDEIFAAKAEAIFALQRNAAEVIIRFLRMCVALRVNRQRVAEQRIFKRVWCAIRTLEHWWTITLPALRAKRSATAHHRRLSIEKQVSANAAFNALIAATALVQRVGRGAVTRSLFKHHFPQLLFNLRLEKVEAALWCYCARRRMRQLRSAHDERCDRLETFELQSRAAIKIQAFARMIVAKRVLRTMKAHHAVQRRGPGGSVVLQRKRNRSARRIQAVWRGYRTRCACVPLREARDLEVANTRRKQLELWAKSVLIGFVLIIRAKRLRQQLHRSMTKERKTARRTKQHAQKTFGGRLGLKDALRKIDADLVSRQAAAQILNEVAGESAIVQRQLNRVLRIDASNVPKIDLEGLCLSNTSEKSKTLEREDDSFEVRMLHRLLQAPTAVLYAFGTYCLPSNTVKPHVVSKPVAHPAPVPGADDASPSPVRQLLGELQSEGEVKSNESTAVIRGSVPTWRLRSDPAKSARLVSSRLGELLLEDENGAPRPSPSLEPFSKWGLAHKLVTTFFSEAATYAWKMIFSHTAHDAYKQSLLTSDEEREARLGRVNQRNQLILACYDCESESQWLSHAKKNLGFVGRIWNPIRYLDPNDPDLEQRAIESYEFVEGFLLQCFPTAYSLRDVPELLVGCGVFLTLKHAMDASAICIPPSSNPEEAAIASLAYDVERDAAQELQLWGSSNYTSAAPSVSHAAATTVARYVAESLAQLRKLSEGCLTPLVTIAPSRRSPPRDEEDTNVVEPNESNIDVLADESGNIGTSAMPSAPESSLPAGHNEYDMENVSHAEQDRARRCYAVSRERDVIDGLPDRTESRLGFMESERDNSSDPPSGETTPATTTVLVERAGNSILAEDDDDDMGSEEDDMDEDDEGDMDNGSGDEEEEDAERDEAIARQIIVSQGIETSFGAASDMRGDASGDPSMAATGNGCFQPPCDDDDECDNEGIVDEVASPEDDAELYGGTLRVEVRIANPAAITIRPKGYLVDLSERLATVLLDIRVDPQMFEEL